MLGAGLVAAVTITCLPGIPPSAALPTWSPSGDRVAYTVPFDESANIDVARPGALRADEGSLSYDSAPTQLAWSPSGDRIAFAKRTGAIAVYTLGRFGGVSEVVHAEPGRPAELGDWSPDGRELVFVRDGHVYVVDAATAEIRYLVDGLHPTWSPDGAEIAYAAGNQLRGIPATGGLTRTIATTDPPAPVTAIAWSPDSSRLAFLGGVIGIVARFAGTPVYTVPAQAPLAWRPNGIFYSVEAVTPLLTHVVFRFDPDTGRNVQITHLPTTLDEPPQFDAYFAAASRDGARIAYELDVGYLHAGVRLVDGDGRNDQPLLACHGTGHPDLVRGSRLNDVIRVNGGGRDRVTCGRGRDIVYADRRDRVARDCERVVRVKL
jgi:Tol biopolymer transport system component